MIILDGKKVSLKILEEVKERVAKLNRIPHLAVILVGDDEASKIYVKNKQIAAEKVGIKSTVIKLPKDTKEEFLLDKINELNNDNDITGILVQLPLPQHIDRNKVVTSILPKKDVDGFTPENVGKLVIGLEPYFYPATPQGVLKLLDEYGLEIEGKNAVVLGRSNIVGKPMAQMLLKRNATVTICHSYTPASVIDEKLAKADIVVSAVGKKVIKNKIGNSNTVVIDVGIHRNSNNHITGDVDFDIVAPNIGYISPVPGGVGPMTIASLMYNASKIYV